MPTLLLEIHRSTRLFVGMASALLLLTIAGCDRGTPPSPAPATTAPTAAPPPDDLAAEEEIAAVGESDEVELDDEPTPDGAAVLRRHVLAAGGERMPMPGESRTFTFELHFTIPNAAERRLEEPTGTMVVQRRAPNLLRTRSTVAGLGEMHGGFDGTMGWAADANSARLREGPSLAELRREAIFDREIHLDLAYPDATLVGEILRDGVDTWRVSLRADDGTVAFGFFRKDNGLLLELVRQLDAPGGQTGVIQRFDRWEEFDGRRYPTLVETRVGASHQTMTLVSVDSTPLDDDVFALPEAVLALMAPPAAETEPLRPPAPPIDGK